MGQKKMEDTVQLQDVHGSASGRFSFRLYFRDARSEFGRIVWPSRAEASKLSVIILGITIGMALLVAALDYVSAEIILVLDRVF
jgi:preprotein translocase SecE subunit